MKNRLKGYQPGCTIRTRRMLLKGAEYYLRSEGPLHTSEIYPLLKDEVTIKGMNPRSMASLMGRSGLFRVVKKGSRMGRLWAVSP